MQRLVYIGNAWGAWEYMTEHEPIHIDKEEQDAFESYAQFISAYADWIDEDEQQPVKLYRTDERACGFVAEFC